MKKWAAGAAAASEWRKRGGDAIARECFGVVRALKEKGGISEPATHKTSFVKRVRKLGLIWRGELVLRA
jgi:hypothetical protein